MLKLGSHLAGKYRILDGAVLMALIAVAPIVVLGWVNVQALREAAEFARQHPGLGPGQASITELVQLVQIRDFGTVIMLCRFGAAILIPTFVFVAWQSLAPDVRQATTVVAMAAMILPAVAQIATMRASEASFEAGSLAVWLHVSPLTGAWTAISGTLVTTVMMLMPASRYPSFLRQSFGLRALIVILLLALYGHQCYVQAISQF